MDKPGRLFLSSLFPGRQVPTESETGAKYPDRHSPDLAGTGVVSTPSGTASPASSVAPKPPIPPQRPLWAATPTINDGQLQLAAW